MELLTILYALLAATIGFGGGDRAATMPGQGIAAEARMATVEIAAPCQQIATAPLAHAVRPPSFVRAQRAARALIGVAPRHLFAIAHWGRRRE